MLPNLVGVGNKRQGLIYNLAAEKIRTFNPFKLPEPGRLAMCALCMIGVGDHFCGPRKAALSRKGGVSTFVGKTCYVAVFAIVFCHKAALLGVTCTDG
jgi:branched-subunit amino acid permease